MTKTRKPYVVIGELSEPCSGRADFLARAGTVLNWFSMKIWKEVIRPGTYFYIDPDTHKPASMTASDEDVRYWHDQGKEMLKAGLSIPIPLEHQPGMGAMTAAEKAAANLKNNAGFIEDYKIRSGNRLYGLHDIPDESLAKKLPSTIKFTSPWFNSFTDGSGKKWEGVISHVALTNRPRIVNQEPFKPEEIALSLTEPVIVPPTKALTPKLGLCLSRAGTLDRGKPRFKGAFAIWSGVKLDTTPLPEPKKKEPPKAKEGEKPPEGKDGVPPKEGEKPPVVPKEGEPALDENGLPIEDEMDVFDVLCDCLSVYDIEMGEGTTEENLVQSLLKVLMDKLKMDMGQPDPAKPATPTVPTAPRSPVIQESPPMFMSLEDVEKIADPTMKRIAKGAFALQTKAINDAKVLRDRRVERIAKKLPVKARDQLLAQAKDAKLSLDENTGAVHDSLNVMLDMLEQSIPDVPTLLTADVSTIHMQHHPEEFNGSVSKERADAIVDGMFGVKAHV